MKLSDESRAKVEAGGLRLAAIYHTPAEVEERRIVNAYRSGELSLDVVIESLVMEAEQSLAELHPIMEIRTSVTGRAGLAAAQHEILSVGEAQARAEELLRGEPRELRILTLGEGPEPGDVIRSVSIDLETGETVLGLGRVLAADTPLGKAYLAAERRLRDAALVIHQVTATDNPTWADLGQIVLLEPHVHPVDDWILDAGASSPAVTCMAVTLNDRRCIKEAVVTMIAAHVLEAAGDDRLELDFCGGHFIAHRRGRTIPVVIS